MKTNIKVIALDLDGTLLNSSHEISVFNREIIKKLKEEGVQIILCTGRPYNAMKKFREELDLDDIIICFNGANVIDSNGTFLLNTSLDDYTSRELVKIGERKNIYHHGFIGDQWLIPYFDETAMGYKEKSGLTESIVDFKDIEKLNFIKMMYIGERAVLEEISCELEEKFGSSIYKAFSTANYLEILSSESSKAKALDFYLKSIGLTSENLLAMGDGYNDLEMLKYAGMGVVMENAPEEMKIQFEHIAPDNNEDGVGVYLKDFFNL